MVYHVTKVLNAVSCSTPRNWGNKKEMKEINLWEPIFFLAQRCMPSPKRGGSADGSSRENRLKINVSAPQIDFSLEFSALDLRTCSTHGF